MPSSTATHTDPAATLDLIRSRNLRRARTGGTLMIAGGVLFAAYLMIRPFTDTAETMGSAAWMVSHLSGMLGFLLLALGLGGLPLALAETRGERVGVAAVVISWLGLGPTLAYYGAETFGLNLLGRYSVAEGDSRVLILAEQLHAQAVPVTVFALGLLLLGIGMLLAAYAIGRSGAIAWHHGVLLAVAYLLLIPQYFVPPPVRIAHGILLALGAIWFAVGLYRRTADTR